MYKPFFRKSRPFFWAHKKIALRFVSLRNLIYTDLTQNYYTLAKRNHIREYRFFQEAFCYLEINIKDPELFYIFRLSRLLAYLFSYNFIFLRFYYENFFSLRDYKHPSSPALYRLIISFSKQKSFFLIQNFKFENILSVSAGFVSKFFQKKKSLRKTKYSKLFLARYLRKIFVLSKLNKLHLIIKGSPIFLNEMLFSLNQRIDHKFWNPIEEKLYDETGFKNPLTYIKISYFVFYKNQAFVPLKTKKKGRIKRKLLRKLVLSNKLVD